MAVRCPRCGLEYDVVLFQFGRTIDCTCGERVGREARIPYRSSVCAGEHRFLADEMLAGLARWLRILGYDTACEPGASDVAVVRRSWQEGRVLLTRDRNLERAWHAPELYVVRADKPLAQLEEVAGRYALRLDDRLFTRCSRCNTVLERVDTETVGTELLPAHVPRDGVPLTRCPACGRVYWEGSHVARMRRTLAARVTGASGSE